MNTLWKTHEFTDGKVMFKNGDELKIQMTRILDERDVYLTYSNRRVCIAWNPQIELWYIYMFDDDDLPKRARFCVERLEIHTVGIFGKMKPKYAPEGTPSFIGTIAQQSTLPDRTSKPLTAHPHVPSKLFVGSDVDSVEFTHGKRVLVDGSKMFCKLP